MNLVDLELHILCSFMQNYLTNTTLKALLIFKRKGYNNYKDSHIKQALMAEKYKIKIFQILFQDQGLKN